MPSRSRAWESPAARRGLLGITIVDIYLGAFLEAGARLPSRRSFDETATGAVARTVLTCAGEGSWGVTVVRVSGGDWGVTVVTVVGGGGVGSS